MDLASLSSPLTQILLCGITGAAVGVLLHCIVLIFLFHPRTPIRIGPATLLGYLPRRKHKLATALGKFLDRELDAIGGMRGILSGDGFLSSSHAIVEQWIDTFLRDHLSTIHPMANALIRGKLGLQLRSMLITQLNRLLPKLLDCAGKELENRLSIVEMIQNHADILPPISLKTALRSSFTHELWLFLLFGALCGGVTGIIPFTILTSAQLLH